MAKSIRDWKVTVTYLVEQPTNGPKIEGSIPATSGENGAIDLLIVSSRNDRCM